MPNNLKGYDAFQVLRSVFDVDKNCLRVCVVDGSPGSGGGVEVIIDHTEDSIRLGDGINFITSTTIGAKVGYDFYQINSPIGTVGDTQTLSMPTANTEYTFQFPIGTKWFEIFSQKRGTIKFGYSSGQRNARAFPGENKRVSDLNLEVATNVYFSSNKASDTLEIHYWI